MEFALGCFRVLGSVMVSSFAHAIAIFLQSCNYPGLSERQQPHAHAAKMAIDNALPVMLWEEDELCCLEAELSKHMSKPKPDHSATAKMGPYISPQHGCGIRLQIQFGQEILQARYCKEARLLRNR